MKHSKKRNAAKPLHYRNDEEGESTDSNKQSVVKCSKQRDLREKLDKKRSSDCNKSLSDQNGYETELIYSGESDDKSDENKVSDKGDEMESGDEEGDCNNNAKKLQCCSPSFFP